MVRNPDPFPRIGDTMHNMYGFQYAMTLYLNIGYYTIYISPEIHYLTTIVTEFGKSRYNRIPMVLYASDGIFQAKVDNILGDINGVKKYINKY